MYNMRFFLVVAIFVFQSIIYHIPAQAEQLTTITEKNDAVSWWIELADQGHANAQYNLGLMYASGENGLNIPKNDAVAFKWFAMAAEQGNMKAQYAVANAYQKGIGVQKDTTEAQRWRRKAAAQDSDPNQSSSAAHMTTKVMAGSDFLEAKRSVANKATTSAVTGVSMGAAPVGEASPDETQKEYWPWWLGSFALAFLTISFWYVIRAPLGVSSSWERILGWREDKALEDAERSLENNPNAIQDALLAETIAQFGGQITDKVMAATNLGIPKTPSNLTTVRAPWHAHMTFLACLLLGGMLASVLAGDFQISYDMGKDYAKFFGSGWGIWSVLLFGGILVGFGTRMCGGCTSGHGLSGCSRLQPGSLLGTAVFFGTAVAVSILLEVGIK